jgi:hypothetical protein
MRVDKALDSIGVIHDLPPVNEIESEDLRELRRFEGESGAHEPARSLFDKITTRPLAYWRPPSASHALVTPAADHGRVTFTATTALRYPHLERATAGLGAELRHRLLNARILEAPDWSHLSGPQEFTDGHGRVVRLLGLSYRASVSRLRGVADTPLSSAFCTDCWWLPCCGQYTRERLRRLS